MPGIVQISNDTYFFTVIWDGVLWVSMRQQITKISAAAQYAREANTDFRKASVLRKSALFISGNLREITHASRSGLYLLSVLVCHGISILPFLMIILSLSLFLDFLPLMCIAFAIFNPDF
jgi:hypothetical protein